jgi:glycosyltransferase involved in cell wall biosynthesis
MSDAQSIRQPLRVLILGRTFSGGGAERCARELFEYLPSVGVEPEMWVWVRRGDEPAEVEPLRAGVERLLFPWNLSAAVNDWRHIGSRWRLDAIGPDRFDVVHLHNLHGRWISIKAVQRLCQRMPVVWTLHDEWAATAGIPYDLTRVTSLDQARKLAGDAAASRDKLGWFCYPTAASQRWRRFLERYMPQPAVLVSPSAYLLDLVSKAGRHPASRLEHLPYGVTLLTDKATRLDRRQARARYNLPADAPVVLLIAAYLTSPYKGIGFGVEALRRLGALSRASRPHVLVLGHSAEEVASRLSGDLQVHTGYARGNEALAAAFRAADVTLLPSVADNFPYVALESLACGTPLVAFRVGGLPEVIGEDRRGILVEPFDTQEMASQTRRLLEDAPLRERLGACGASWVRQQCDLPAYLRRIVAIYQAAIRGFQASPLP